MAKREATFNRDLTAKIAALAMAWVRPKIPSRTLQKALNTFQDADDHAWVQIPHYWALYVHDGRGPFGPTRTTFLVWFRDIRNDPRLRNGVTPERATQLRQLTRDEFKYWSKQNRLARRAGFLPPMIVARRVGKGVPGARFFESERGGGMTGFADRVTAAVRTEVRDWIVESLGVQVGVFETDRAVGTI